MHPFFKWIGFPIRKSADQFIFADPRGLSQLITSFIASESQGIPRVPFLTFFYTCHAFARDRMLFDMIAVLLQVFPSADHDFLLALSITSLSSLSLSPKPTTVSTVVFSFSITSSNMSKNMTPSLLKRVCIISYPFRETEGVVENNGFEPLTPCVQGRCSSQLS